MREQYIPKTSLKFDVVCSAPPRLALKQTIYKLYVTLHCVTASQNFSQYNSHAINFFFLNFFLKKCFKLSHENRYKIVQCTCS